MVASIIDILTYKLAFSLFLRKKAFENYKETEENAAVFQLIFSSLSKTCSKLFDF